MSNRNELYKSLWNTANVLRGKMDPDEFKNYILGFIFFKHLSEKLEEVIIDEIGEINKLNDYSDEQKENLKNIIIDSIGYWFNPSFSFKKIIKNIDEGNKNDLIEFIDSAFKEIVESTVNRESNDDFKGLFSDIDLYNPKLGDDYIERSNTLSKIISNINDVDWNVDDDSNDILGDAYEYLISQFASSAGKKGGEFYTPSEVSQILAKIVTSQDKKIRSIYDPTNGSGSLLIKAYTEIVEQSKKDISKYNKADIESIQIRGQELNHTTYNLARMNMFLHGIRYDNFKLKQGDTIRNDKFENEKFDAIVANPPFGTEWDPTEKQYLIDDERFSKYGVLAPKSRAEYVFVQHMLEHLGQEGLMATVLPHGVLFRGGTEETIRRHIVEKDNYLDAIIGLPSNLFFGTGIPALIAVYKKCRKKDEDILFIDASKGFVKEKNQNKLNEKHISDIVDVYVNKKEILKTNEKYDLISRNVSFDEIKENNFNLNISRYIDDFEEIKYRELDEIQKDIDEIRTEKTQLEKELQELLKQIKI